MKKIIISAALIFIVAVFAGKTFSQPEMDGRHPMRERMKEKLNLTEEQDSKMDALRSAHQKKMIDLKANLEKAEVDAKDVRDKDNISRAEVISSVEKISKIKNEIALAVANHRMDVYEILTSEQRKEWKEFREDHPLRDGKERREEFKEKFRMHMDQ